MSRGLRAAVLLVGGLVAVLIAFDAWPGLRGPESWRWGYRPIPMGRAILGVLAAFVATTALGLRMRRVWGGGSNFERSPLLIAVIALLFTQMVLLTAAEPGGLSNVPRRVLDPAFTSYHTIARDVDDVPEFLRRYAAIQGRFPVHGPSQPPGRVLFFHAVNEWAAKGDRTERLLHLGERLGGVPPGPPGTTEAQRAGALAAGFLLLAIGALSIVPLTVLAGGRCAPGAVGGTVVLMAGLPSFLLFTPETDHLILFFALTAAALKVEAMRYASRRWAPALAFGAGLAGGLGILVSFTTIAALAAIGIGFTGMVALGLRRRDPFPTPGQMTQIGFGALAGFLLVPALTAMAGLDWIAVFAAANRNAHRVQVLVFKRAYSEWVVWNLWDFVLFLGPGLAIAWLARIGTEARAFAAGAGFVPAGPDGRSRLPLEIPLAIALLVALVALDVSGRILGETGRIWMFLMPLAVVAAASASEGRPGRELVPLALAQLLVLTALRLFVNVPG